MKKFQLLFFLVSCAAGNALADHLSLGLPSVEGTGCSSNTVAAVLSPDAEQLSILFDAYTVEAQGEEKVERKNCNISVPVHIPKDTKISIFQMDFRGYTSLPKNATSILNIDHDFFGNQGPKTTETFNGERDGEFLVSHKIAPDKHIWSKCGEVVNLRVRSSIKVKTNKRGQQALATVDTVDMYSGMVYKIRFKPCKRKENRGRD